MSIDRWQPREELTRQEQALMKRLDRVRKLLGFLRVHRRRLFDDDFQGERDSSPLEGAGRVEDTFNLLGRAARNL